MAIYPTSLDIGDYVILQDTDDYAFAQDSVFLVNVAKPKSSDVVLDLGCGSSILSTLAIVKYGVKKAVGIELQERVCNMARESAALNKIEDRLTIICGDVKDIRNLVKAESFDKVLCNPPYFLNNSGREILGREISRTESTATLDNFVGAASFALKFGGEMYLVIKADRMARAYHSLLSHNLMPKHTTLVYPRQCGEVDIVIIKAKKGAHEGMTTSTLYVQDKDGNYTNRYKELYN